MNPAYLDFGTHDVGDHDSATVTITNNGTANLEIYSISFTSGTSSDFTLSATAPLTLTPGSSTTFTVDYDPTNICEDTGEVEIYSNDPVTPYLYVSLFGFVPEALTRIYPTAADCTSCTSASGRTYPCTGTGAANWFVWSSCGTWREFTVTPGETYKFHIHTDCCSGCMLTDIGLEISEDLGSYEVSITVDPEPDPRTCNSLDLYYVPLTDTVRVEVIEDSGRGCYLEVYHYQVCS